jgi:hypothetical protein
MTSLSQRARATDGILRAGLDLDLFDKDLSGHVHAARVHEDFMSGVRRRERDADLLHRRGSVRRFVRSRHAPLSAVGRAGQRD